MQCSQLSQARMPGTPGNSIPKLPHSPNRTRSRCSYEIRYPWKGRSCGKLRDHGLEGDAKYPTGCGFCSCWRGPENDPRCCDPAKQTPTLVCRRPLSGAVPPSTRQSGGLVLGQSRRRATSRCRRSRTAAFGTLCRVFTARSSLPRLSAVESLLFCPGPLPRALLRSLAASDQTPHFPPSPRNISASCDASRLQVLRHLNERDNAAPVI